MAKSLENLVLVQLPTFSPGVNEGQYRNLVHKGMRTYDGNILIRKKNDKIVLFADGRYVNLRDLYESLCVREGLSRKDFAAVVIDPGFTPGARELMNVGFGVDGVRGDRVILKPRRSWWSRKLSWEVKCYYLYEPIMPEHLIP